jgi:hypothetical protein
MENIERTVTIGATAREIFKYLNEPRKIINLVPGAKEIDILEHKVQGGWLFEWKSSLCGVLFEGRGECAVCIPYQFISYELSEGLNLVVNWRLKPVQNDTHVTMTIEYNLPLPLQRKHTLADVTAHYAAEAERILHAMAASLSEQESAQISAG